MSINQFTRAYYDNYERNNHKILSEAPLRYYVNPISKQFTHANPSQLNIETESELIISRPTRLNEFQKHNTELFGTAPLTTRYDGPVDEENKLLESRVSNFNTCVKPSVEEFNYFERQILHPDLFAGVPLSVEDTQRAGISTRNDYRNTRIFPTKQISSQ